MSQETRNATFYNIQRAHHFDLISISTITSVRALALKHTGNWMMCKLYPPSIFANKENKRTF